MWRNSTRHYGLITIGLHWLVAIAVLGLFGLGLWMVELSYYDPWYKRGPELHKSIGVLLFALMLVRLLWRYANARPRPEGSALEQGLASIVHSLLYALLLLLMISGYLISTADGRAIEVFNWFSVPATLSDLPQQEDVAGVVHQWLAYGLVGLTALHALAALKHHFINRDRTLKRMLSANP